MTFPGLDATRPSGARIYDYLLGGKDSYHADRELTGQLLEICPSLRGAAGENRGFASRAVTWAAQQGIAQFADLGTGFPARPSAGEAARAVIPGARIAYIDNDPFVALHVRATRAHARSGDGYEPVEGVAVAEADLREPGKVMASPDLLQVIDPAEPVCVILGLVLNLMPAREAREVVAGYADLIAPGSLVVVSCGRCDDEVMWKEFRAACTAAAPRNHTRRQVAGFLAGLEPVPPGIVAAQNWRGGWHDVPAATGSPVYVLAGVARKAVR